jgi:hypothetical protein
MSGKTGESPYNPGPSYYTWPPKKVLEKLKEKTTTRNDTAE